MSEKFYTDQGMHFIGIDIGSTSSKVAVMDERGEFCELFLLPSGFSAVKVARQIKQALEQKGYAEGFVTATGYGRVSVEYAQLSMSEILCHGLGAHFLFEQDCTVIDVGGQDTKAIKIENGKPADFIMNDKCSAGTGKFLEISAGRLGLELSEIYKTARKNPAIKISSTCTVFAESEIVSLSANGAETSEIAYAIVDSSAHKVASLIKRLENQIYFLSGGLSNVPLFKQLLGEHLGAEIFTCENAIYCGAMGAALIGARKANEILKETR